MCRFLRRYNQGTKTQVHIRQPKVKFQILFDLLSFKSYFAGGGGGITSF